MKTLFLIIAIGYLLGSFSPSYILGRLLKKTDLRSHGLKYAGTSNVYSVLGLGPAVITAVFDLGKGLAAMSVASLLGASPSTISLAGFAAIVGHVFPFYLNFKGGQGTATATGILLYYLALFYARQWLPWESLPILVFCVLSFAYISKRGEFVGTVVLPILAVMILVFSPTHLDVVVILSVMTFILFMNIRNILHRELLNLSSSKAKGEINWRLYLRPLALLLLLVYMSSSKKDTLTLIGSIALFFLALDLVRLFSKKINVFFFKNVKDFYRLKEYKKFSSMTIFLFAVFLTVLLFEKSIAIVAVSYLIFGDFFSKFFGIQFGRKRIFEKSLEGSLAHLNACLISGYIFLYYISVPIPVYLTGAFVATVSEALPLGVNDNFSVALLSASSMYVFLLF